VRLLEEAHRLQQERRSREAFATISEALAAARAAEANGPNAATATVIISGTLLHDRLALELGETGPTYEELESVLARARRAARVDSKLGETLKDSIAWLEQRTTRSGGAPESRNTDSL
jgi:hypothetical protein